jgi:hypothetical protein
MDDSRLTKHIFNYDYDLCKLNWSSDVKNIFLSVGLIDIFTDKAVCNTENLKSLLNREMENNWRAVINQKPKLRTYVKYKYDFCTEPYVLSYMSKRHRSLLAQFRLGILPLHIETGRFVNTCLTDRICTFCI